LHWKCDALLDDTMAKQKRDSQYFRQRLKTRNRAIFDALEDGTYKSTRSAALAAGLIKNPTKLDALKRAWKKASRAEQDDFLKWIGRSAPTGARIVDDDDYPEDWVGDRVWQIMRRRGIDQKRVTRELGLKPLDTSLWGAITPRAGRRRTIRPALVTALEKWLADNKDV